MIYTHNPILSSCDDDATHAYLYQASGNPSIHAMTRDALGSNLPTQDLSGDWILDREFALGVREVMPINVAPEPVFRGLAADGYVV